MEIMRKRFLLKRSVTLSVVVRTITGCFTQLLLNLVNLRDLFGVGTKLKENMLKNNQINSIVTTRQWVLSTEWTRTWASTGLVSK